MNVAALDVLEQTREPFDQSRSLDAAHGLALAHAKTLETKVVQRRARRTKIEAAIFDLHEVNEQPPEEAPRLEADRMQTGQKLFVGEMCERHPALLHPRFSASQAPRVGAVGMRVAWQSLQRPIGDRRLTSRQQHGIG